METYTFDHLAPGFREVHLALYKGIPDGAGAMLKSQLVAASSLPEDSPERDAVNFAFIDASTVISLEAALTATHQALLAASRGPSAMKSATVHGEIIYSFHPANNIGDALRTFGVGPQTKDLLIIRVSPPTTDEQKQRIQGAMSAALGAPEVTPTPDLKAALPRTANLPKIAKAYKLIDSFTVPAAREDPKSLERLVVTAISIKSVAG